MRRERREGWTDSGRRERLLSRFGRRIWATVDTTTRFPPIALQFAPNDAITIPELIHTMRGSGYILREAWMIAHEKHTQFLHSSLKLGIFRHKRTVGG